MPVPPPPSLVDPPVALRVVAWLAFGTGTAMLLVGGTGPQAVGLIPAPWDKLAHAVLFAGFAGLAWVGAGARPPRAARIALAAAIAVGLADEFAQSFAPGRVADAGDLLADAIGAWVAVRLLAGWRARGRGAMPRP